MSELRQSVQSLVSITRGFTLATETSFGCTTFSQTKEVLIRILHSWQQIKADPEDSRNFIHCLHHNRLWLLPSSRRHNWRPRKRNKYEQTRRNRPALNKQKEASIVARALSYRHVVITSKRGSATKMTKWQLKFETVMCPNTWQVKTRMPKACSAPVCFRKTMTAEVESAAALIWNAVTLSSPVRKVKF